MAHDGEKQSPGERPLPETMTSPFDGSVMRRGTRPVTISYGGKSVVVDLPGYYPEHDGEGVHVGDDLKVADDAVAALKWPNGG